MTLKPLGQLLVNKKVLAPLKLRAALEDQETTGNRIATECYEQGFASEEDLLHGLSTQVGIPGLLISRLVVHLDDLRFFSEQEAKSQLIFPVRSDRDTIYLAMADPANDEMVSEVAFQSGRKIEVYIALAGLLRQFIGEAYAARERGEKKYWGKNTTVEDEHQLPIVFSKDLTHIPQELIRPERMEGGADSMEDAGLFSGIIIAVDDGVSGDLVIALEDHEEFSEPEIPCSEESAPEGIGVDLDVLVVDDDPDIRHLVSRILTEKNLIVHQACRGLEALSLIKNAPPDLIILDAMLPEIHGFDICRKIKSSERFSNIPVIMISSVYKGWRFAQDLKESYGVDAFIEKPFTIDDLWNTIEKVLASRTREVRNNRKMLAQAEEFYRNAVKQYKAGDLAGAIQSCRKGLDIDPLSSRLHYRLGILYLNRKGRVYQAMQEFEEAVALDPTLFSAIRILAVLYQRKGFKNKAIEMWERAIKCRIRPETAERIRKHLRSLI